MKHLNMKHKNTNKVVEVIVRKKLLVEAISLAIAVGLTTPAIAVPLLPNPNPAGNTIPITAGNNAINYAGITFHNYGDINVLYAGVLTNQLFATLHNHNNINNFGSTANYGLLTNWAGANINNHGALGTSGILLNYGNLSNAGYLANSNSLENSGSLTNTGILTNTGTGTLSNTGTLTNANQLFNHGSMNNSGTLTNGGGLANYGSLTNTGNIYKSGGGTTTLGNDGTLLNSAGKVYMDHVINTGGITNAAYFNSTFIDNSNTLYNAPSGEFRAYSIVNRSDATLSNAGLFNAGYTTQDSVNYGTLLNSGTMYFSNLGNSGIVSNSGVEMFIGGLLRNTNQFSNYNYLFAHNIYNTGNIVNGLNGSANVNELSNKSSPGYLGYGGGGTVGNYGYLSIHTINNGYGGRFTNSVSGEIETSYIYNNNERTGLPLRPEGAFINNGLLTVKQRIVNSGVSSHNYSVFINNGELIANRIENHSVFRNTGKLTAQYFVSQGTDDETVNNGNMYVGQLGIDEMINNAYLHITGVYDPSLSGVSLIDGYLNNYGSLYLDYNGPFSILKTSSGPLNNFGTTYVRGQLINNAGMTSVGVIYNNGIIDNNHNFANSGAVHNYATIRNTAAILNTGTINNSGTLTSTATASIANLNSINNIDGGVVINHGHIGNDGSIENAGVVHVSSAGVIDGNGVFVQTAGNTFVDGSLSANVIAFQGGSVEGNGTISSPNYIDIGANADVAPGNPDADRTGNLTFNSDFNVFGTLTLEFDSLTDFDTVSVFGDSIFQPGSNVDLLFGFTPAAGSIYTFLFSSSLAGFDDISFTVSGHGSVPYRITELDGNLSASFVPLPAALPLFVSALAGMGLFGWRLKNKRR